MNTEEIRKIAEDIQRDSQEINQLWANIYTWNVEDFVLNSELVTNYIHNIFDNIVLLQSKYTTTDNQYLGMVTELEMCLEEGKLYDLRQVINKIIEYLK